MKRRDAESLRDNPMARRRRGIRQDGKGSGAATVVATPEEWISDPVAALSGRWDEAGGPVRG